MLGLTSSGAALTTKLSHWQSRWQNRNRERLIDMLPQLAQLALLATLLLGLFHVLRLQPSRKRLSRD